MVCLYLVPESKLQHNSLLALANAITPSSGAFEGVLDDR